MSVSTATSQHMPGLGRDLTAHERDVAASLLSNQSPRDNSDAHAAMIEGWVEEADAVVGGGPPAFSAEQTADILAEALADDNAGSDQSPSAGALGAPNADAMDQEDDIMSEVEDNDEPRTSEPHRLWNNMDKVFSKHLNSREIVFTPANINAFVKDAFTDKQNFTHNTCNKQVVDNSFNRSIFDDAGVSYEPTGFGNIEITDFGGWLKFLDELWQKKSSGSSGPRGAPNFLNDPPNQAYKFAQQHVPHFTGKFNNSGRKATFLVFRNPRFIQRADKHEIGKTFYMDQEKRAKYQELSADMEDRAKRWKELPRNSEERASFERCAVLSALCHDGTVTIRRSVYHGRNYKLAEQALVDAVTDQIYQIHAPPYAFGSTTKPNNARFFKTIAPLLNADTQQQAENLKHVANHAVNAVTRNLPVVLPLTDQAVGDAPNPDELANQVLNCLNHLDKYPQQASLALETPDFFALCQGASAGSSAEQTTHPNAEVREMMHGLNAALAEGIANTAIQRRRVVDHVQRLGDAREAAENTVEDTFYDGFGSSPAAFTAEIERVARVRVEQAYATGPVDIRAITFEPRENMTPEQLEEFGNQVVTNPTTRRAVLRKYDDAVKKATEELESARAANPQNAELISQLESRIQLYHNPMAAFAAEWLEGNKVCVVGQIIAQIQARLLAEEQAELAAVTAQLDDVISGARRSQRTRRQPNRLVEA